MNLPENLADAPWWSSFEHFEHVVRPALVAAGRARVASNDWPAPLEVADAVLAGIPRRRRLLRA